MAGSPGTASSRRPWQTLSPWASRCTFCESPSQPESFCPRI
jgi:hypothetical protein